MGRRHSRDERHIASQHAAFTNAEFVVQNEHHAFARTGDERFEMAQALCDNLAIRFRLVDGDAELLSGVDLVESNGHDEGQSQTFRIVPDWYG